MEIPLIGLLISFTCLIPGFGTGQVILFCLTLKPECVVYAICCSLIINTLKEASLPEISGNYLTMSNCINSIRVDSINYFRNLIKNKLICWFIGSIIGLLFNLEMAPPELVLVLIICLIITEEHKLSLFIWFIFILIIYISESDNFVLVTSLLVFNVPEILKINNSNKVTLDIEDISKPNYALVWIGTIITMVLPGLSSSTLFTKMAGNSRDTLITVSVIDTVIEAAGLVLLCRNITNGKSLIGDLGTISNSHLYIQCTGLILICFSLVWLIHIPVIKFYERENIYAIYISTILSIAMLIVIKINLLLIILSIVVSVVLKRIKCNSNLKGYTFSVPILMG